MASSPSPPTDAPMDTGSSPVTPVGGGEAPTLSRSAARRRRLAAMAAARAAAADASPYPARRATTSTLTTVRPNQAAPPSSFTSVPSQPLGASERPPSQPPPQAANTTTSDEVGAHPINSIASLIPAPTPPPVPAVEAPLIGALRPPHPVFSSVTMWQVFHLGSRFQGTEPLVIRGLSAQDVADRLVALVEQQCASGLGHKQLYILGRRRTIAPYALPCCETFLMLTSVIFKLLLRRTRRRKAMPRPRSTEVYGYFAMDTTGFFRIRVLPALRCEYHTFNP